MISQSHQQLVRSLHDKKGRNETGKFFVEGTKGVLELLQSSLVVDALYATSAWCDEFDALLQTSSAIVHIAEESELKKLSLLTTHPSVLAVARIPQTSFSAEIFDKQPITLVLDGVRDPGNLGTILRLADWFGCTEVVCSIDSVDAWNPKVVQATMGSLFRMHVIYEDLFRVFHEAKIHSISIIGASMEGKSVYEVQHFEKVLLVMGSESHGLSNATLHALDETISIPKNNEQAKIDSLNVAMATGIIMSELERKRRAG